MRAVSAAPAYRDFTFPLNVFMHILTSEEGEVRYLHYGIFDDPSEPLLAAQERSTSLLLSRLPPPPARLLEAGIGLGTTLHRLSAAYRVEGLTPDAHQIAYVRERYPSLEVHCAPFEAFASDAKYDAVIFQESSQYIDAEALFARAAMLTSRIIVLDEFALKPVEGLHSLDAFLEAATRHGFKVSEQLDLSKNAAPTMAYFTNRIPAYREQLKRELGLEDQHIDHLIESGATYRQRYASGVYGYRLLVFEGS
jgi:hypothetical protein